MFSAAKIKGAIGTLPEVPGLLLYHSGHGDLRIENGSVAELAASLPGEGEDLQGAHIFPGFIDAFSVWGINGSMN